MMKPYQQKDLSRDKRIFSYCLFHARRISENAFGILTNHWRVFRKPFLLKPEKAKVITYSVLILHNFLRSESDTRKSYISPNLIDFNDGCGTVIPGDWRKMHPVAHGSIWNHLQIENFQDKLRALEKNSSIFCEQRKCTMAMESSTSRRLKGSKKNIFNR